MFRHLQIYDPRERAAVGLTDLALKALTKPLRLGRVRAIAPPPARVLVLRLERIGDLLMTFVALAQLRASLPSARIDLVVGRWNEPLARAMAVADRIDALDAPWLARHQPGVAWPRLLSHARGWRRHAYDLAINLEPDIRSNLLLWLSGAPRRAGYYSGGGGALLTDAAAYDPTAHTQDNASRLIALALGGPFGFEPGAAGPDVLSPDLGAGPASSHVRPPLEGRSVCGGVGPPRQACASPHLQLPEAARERARLLLAPAGGSLCIGLHASGGRPVKQWHAGRFAEVATALGREYGATVVLTGTAEDAAIVGEVQAAMPDGVRVLNLAGRADLLDLAAVLERLAVVITGDTGPMHLAAAVGTPVVALFGPSNPARYGPRGATSRIVRVDLPCSPCNRIRLPPERCRGHVPECLDGISMDRVLAAAREVLIAGGTP